MRAVQRAGRPEVHTKHQLFYHTTISLEWETLVIPAEVHMNLAQVQVRPSSFYLSLHR